MPVWVFMGLLVGSIQYAVGEIDGQTLLIGSGLILAVLLMTKALGFRI